MAHVKKISSAQVRAARALIRWTALDLAVAAKVGVATIRRAEVVDGEVPVTLAIEAAIHRAFEAAGIDFIEDNGGGEGVRFASRKDPKNGCDAMLRRSGKKLVSPRTTIKTTAQRTRPPSRPRHGKAVRGRSLDVLNQYARLPHQRPKLPAFLDGFARTEAVLQRVLVAARSA